MSNYEKYLMTRDVKEVEIKVGEDVFKITVKALPWSVKTDIVSRALSWDAAGVMKFNASQYMKDTLKYIIVSAPWGEPNEIFLARVGPELGAALEQLTPGAFAPEGKLEEAKKEPTT